MDYVEQGLVPFLKPALADEVKGRGRRWLKILPILVDPADKFVYVSKVKISPQRSRIFLKETPSSSKHINDTYLF